MLFILPSITELQTNNFKENNVELGLFTGTNL